MSTGDKTQRFKITSYNIVVCGDIDITCHMSMSCHIISCYRCLIEEHYGKALIKLAKSFSGKDEMG